MSYIAADSSVQAPRETPVVCVCVIRLSSKVFILYMTKFGMPLTLVLVQIISCPNHGHQVSQLLACSEKHRGQEEGRGSLTPSHFVWSSWTSGSQSAISGPAASASLETCWKSQFSEVLSHICCIRNSGVWGFADDAFTSSLGDAHTELQGEGDTWPGRSADRPLTPYRRPASMRYQ